MHFVSQACRSRTLFFTVIFVNDNLQLINLLFDHRESTFVSHMVAALIVIFCVTLKPKRCRCLLGCNIFDESVAETEA